jgi:hypothetical protein
VAGVGPDARLTAFQPLPLLNALFERTIPTLLDAGVETASSVTGSRSATRSQPNDRQGSLVP